MLTRISYFFQRISRLLLKEGYSKSGFIFYLRNIQWVAISKIATMTLSLITTMFVARILGPELFGTLSYTQSVIGLFAAISSLGISAVTYKQLVESKHDREEILGTSILLSSIMGLIAITSVCFYLYNSTETPPVKLLIFLLSLSFLSYPFSLLSIDFLKDGDSKYATIAQLITQLISSISKILGCALFSSLVFFIIVLVLENVISGLIYIYQIKNLKQRSLRLTVSRKRFLHIFLTSLPLAFMLVFSEIYTRIDQIMLKHYMDLRTVGIYSAAARLTEIWFFVPNVLITALFPALVHSSQHSERERGKRVSHFIKALIFSSVCIIGLTYLFQDLLIKIIYGNSFSESAKILSIYILSIPGSFVSMIILQDFFITNKKILMILLPATTALINIILNVFLIPHFGATGAAYATVISYSTTSLFFFLLTNKNK